MYSAWLSTKDNYPLGKCVYDNSIAEPEMTFIDPNLKLTAGAAGEFTFGIAPTQLYYDSFTKMTSIINIVRDGKIIWEGRIIDEEMDFFKTKNFTCEGAMAYFNDTLQEPIEAGTDLRTFLNIVIQQHNIQSGTEKHKIFKLGQISQEVIPSENFKTEYENTLEVLNRITDEYGGYFHITWNEYGEKILNYYSDTIINTLPPVVQSIEFGKNLLDYTHSYDLTEMCTVVLPIGATLKIGGGWAIKVKGSENDYILDSDDNVLRFESKKKAKEYTDSEGLDMEYYEIVEMKDEKDIPITVSSLGDITEASGITHLSGTPYIFSQSAVENYGWIAKKVDFSEVTDPMILYYLSVEYLEKGQFAKMNIDITAFDMALLNKKIDGLPAIPKKEGE